ncbi:MAG: hypothetical protein HFG78_15380 [Hungatella sp.]|nr:hypothetical protein [Hungatella sp.]
MRQVILLGTPGTKRTVYLEKAARSLNVTIKLLDWKEGDWRQLLAHRQTGGPGEMLLKIDPPVWDSCCLEDLDRLARSYEKDLKALAGLEKEVVFFNNPLDMARLLDKRQCKRDLEGSGIPVTRLLGEEIRDTEHLLEAMERKNMSQVFLKPVQGSGAAGAAAFRYQKKTGHMVLYTCGMEDPNTGRLVNTKRLRRFTNRSQVLSLLERILKLDSIVERWYAKAEYQGFSYDLRAVVQRGQVDFVLARLSRGPITNLHLNNRPLRASNLGLPGPVMEQVEELCLQTASRYRGINSMGLDILLEKGSLRPRIIELNGQGDLIYQDIYSENRIYRHQAEIMKEWLYGED